jgi:hypothetical protein
MLANVFTKTARDRWRGTAIGAGSLALLLYFGMSLYRQFDLSVYDSLPDVVRSIINLPEGTDVAGLAYGAIYGTYGALTLAALALAMGSGAIAGEERDGTIGLLLANPASRTKVLLRASCCGAPACCRRRCSTSPSEGPTSGPSCSTYSSTPSSTGCWRWRSAPGPATPGWRRGPPPG